MTVRGEVSELEWRSFSSRFGSPNLRKPKKAVQAAAQYRTLLKGCTTWFRGSQTALSLFITAMVMGILERFVGSCVRLIPLVT